MPQNTTKFSNFFDDLEESPEENTGSQPQIKIKKLKKRLLQVDQQLAKFEHDLALKAMEAKEIREKWNKA